MSATDLPPGNSFSCDWISGTFPLTVRFLDDCVFAMIPSCISQVASTRVNATLFAPTLRDAISVRSEYWYVLEAPWPCFPVSQGFDFLLPRLSDRIVLGISAAVRPTP